MELAEKDKALLAGKLGRAAKMAMSILVRMADVYGTEHLRPFPGTDTALALGMTHVIVREGLHDSDYIERYTVGFEPLKTRLDDYSPDRVAEITGLRLENIVELAKTYARTRPAAIQIHIGIEQHAHGAMTYRTIAGLPAPWALGAKREEDSSTSPMGCSAKRSIWKA